MKITLPITVIAFETDYDGVVSNTRYLEYIERGRYALLHATGLKVREVWEHHGVQPVVRGVEINYLGFARHEDDLRLIAWVDSHSGATTMLRYEIERVEDGAVLMRAMQTVAYVNTKRKPTRVPAIFREVLSVENDGGTETQGA
jgi:YbgC/YbaW family acyl-CoA thioester hydrolase